MSLAHRIEATAARAGLRVLRALGPVRASNLGGAVARAIGPLLPASRVADTNLRLVLPELDAAGRRGVVRGAWENLGRTVGEFPHLGRLPMGAAEGPGWRVEGAEHVEALAAAGGPAIFATAHFGNWEMLPPACAFFGAPPSSFFRPADNRAIDAIIAELRAEAGGGGVAYFPKGAGRGGAGAGASEARRVPGGAVRPEDE